MIELTDFFAATIALQLDRWQRASSTLLASPRERCEARKKFLALAAEYPDIAKDYGFSPTSVQSIQNGG